ncbi:tRNA(m(1)G37)methyltransferase [Pichia californica]|uniref:tRNA (guanine(37)-N1)-methyltransferase n=1 Tax=Pichia californica TaxID=460514 RepID=A0A9P7BFZ9_9ASCO|nr:tRNA(m(1)G37)methyltransferase [[Candida] californica]KAG0688655.1 tRNA(m(1)G37)methyltransferase [[Candida] californica]
MSTYIPLAELRPPRNEGMIKLDKSKFIINRKVWALLLPEIKYVNEFLGRKNKNSISGSIVLSIPQHASLVEFNRNELSTSLFDFISPKNSKLKAILLKEDIKVTEEDERHESEEDYEPQLLKENIPESTYQRLKELNVRYKTYTLSFDFNYWSYDDILKAVLPDELIEQCPSAFTIAGHLAHLNLKEKYMPYRNIIGEIILNKFPNIKTVVNKTNNITSEFRTFQMEVLAGEDNFVVTQKESGCSFTFDFQKVYWNSRLATEHERLINSFGIGEVVCDVMGGVGPFAIPAGKKPCLVFANDLNPESYKYLKINIETNKVDSFVKPYNLDGRDFIRKSPIILREFQKLTPYIKYTNKQHNKEKDTDSEQPKKKRMLDFDVPVFVSHYVMNLPDLAMTFVNAYRGLLINGYPGLSKQEIMNLPGYKLPIINVHHFEKYKEEEISGEVEPELARKMHKKIVDQLNFNIDITNIKFHVVRQVAPCKLMYCISFQLPEEVAFTSD